MKRTLAWGMGLDSTVLAVMSALGELPKLDLVLACDPGWERKATYEVGAFYQSWLSDRGLDVRVIKTGNIRQQGAKEHIHVPFYTSTGAPLNRQCNRHFKIRPARRFIREWLGYPASVPPAPPARSVEQWIGFAADEWTRCRLSDVAYIVHRWPLIELGMTRQGCADYLSDRGLPVPCRSACVCCPWRSAGEWLEMKLDDPDEFEAACRFDEQNRHNPLAVRGQSTSDELYLYSPPGGSPESLRSADLEKHAKENVVKPVQLPIPSLVCV